jgi:hypothetical protein
MRVLALFILLQWVRGCLANNASISYSSGAQQKILGWTESPESQDESYYKYLKWSIKQELQQRLSAGARIVLGGEDEFSALDVRYTNYKRPSYIAAVQAAEENDVIETVSTP